MRSEDAIEAINVICDRLGLAIDSATEIIPELVKREITIGLFWIVLSIVIIGLSIKVISLVVSKAKKDLESRGHKSIWNASLDGYEYVEVVSFVAGALIIVFTLVLLFSAKNTIAYIVSPKGSAIIYVLDLIG